MKTLMVTPFAPYRDGIATYAVQELRRLRDGTPADSLVDDTNGGGGTARGYTVDVLSPLPSAARWHLRLGGPRSMVQLANRAADYDRTIIQFGPEMLFGGCGSSARRVAVWAGLAGLAKRTSLDLRIHEIEYGPLEQNPLERRAARLAFQQADRVTVHTEAERVRLAELVGSTRIIEVVDHGRDFQAAVEYSQADARSELGLAAEEFLFVAIGFIQHHKGFDRAIDAMEALPPAGAHLHIVGSARVDHPDITGYVDELAGRCAGMANATLHQRFVSDVEFDLWLQAADVVVLPYREIWSSGVVERARLFGTQILASDLPQLRDQAPPGTMFFDDIDELAIAMEKLSSGGRSSIIGRADGPATASHGPSAGRDASDGRFDRGTGRTVARRPAWNVDQETPDRVSLQAQIVARARNDQIATVEVTGRVRDDRRPVDPLLALGHLHRPEPNSARPGVAPVKRLIERLIGWQVEPLAKRIEDMQRATVDAVSQLDRRLEAASSGDLDAGSTGTEEPKPNGR